MLDSAHRKVLRIMGRGRDSPTNNKEPEYEYGSVPKHLRGFCLVKKDEYLTRNGAYLFEELVKSTHGKNNPFRIFSLKELQKATNNFSEHLISTDPYIGAFTYRGSIEGRSITAKIRGVHHHALVDEVVSLSLIKHRNVVKLLGCCLETDKPIVVLDMTHIPPPVELLWTDRLRIATDIADAVAYLHSELQITHGRLWDPQAVLLDEFHSAKLSAFEYSEIQNKADSSDVETDNRIKLRRRMDVYDFGNILLNLLGIELGEVEERCDKVEILKYLKPNVSEKEMPQIETYIDLLLRCRPSDEQRWNMSYKRMKQVVGEDELSMVEVARELRRIRRMINPQPTTDGNKSDNLSSGANASPSNNTSTSYQEVTSEY